MADQNILKTKIVSGVRKLHELEPGDTVAVVSGGTGATTAGTALANLGAAAVGDIITAHSGLSGLSADDHAQYHTDARGDLRYYTQVQLNGGSLDARYYTETEADSQLALKQSTSEKGQPNGYASLDGTGKVFAAQIPSIGVSNVFVVADIAARDALVVASGDIAKVADNGSGLGESFVYDGATWISLNSGESISSLSDVDTVAVAPTTGDLLSWNGSNWVPASPGMLDVGSYLDRSSTTKTVQEFTTSTAGATYLSTTLTAAHSATYKWHLTYGWALDTAKSDFTCSLEIDGVQAPTLDHVQEAKDSGGGGIGGTSQNQPASASGTITFTAGNHLFEIKYAPSNGGVEAILRYAVLTLERWV